MLPTVPFSAKGLCAIIDSQAHSLRCLSIVSDSPYVGSLVQDVINKLPLLHTVHISVLTFVVLQRLVSPIITHLLLDFQLLQPDLVQILSNQVPALHTLSITGYVSRGYRLRNVIKLLVVRPLIRTVYVSKADVIVYLTAAVPSVRFREYQGINIFQNEY